MLNCMIKNVLLISLVLLNFSCNAQDTIFVNTKMDVFCDVENVNNKNEIISNGKDPIVMKGGALRTTEFSKSGKYSLKLSNSKQYGFAFKIGPVDSDDYIYAEVWRKSNNNKGVISISSTDTVLKFYKQDSRVIEKNKEGWEKIVVEAFVPINVKNGTFKIYVWNQSEEPVYFDDFKVQIKKLKEYPEYTEKPLELIISEKQFSKLKLQRENALSKGVIIKNDDSYIKAKMVYGEDTFKIQLRLKGDWVDHISGDKWSFRISIKSENSWNGLKTFSIQNAQARSMLDEWVYHKMLLKEDVLTTRYSFVPVKINGVSKGIFAVEEHFEKQLIESNNRREGLILKFSEDDMWTARQDKDALYANLPFVEASNIESFKMSKVLKDEKFKNLFYIGQNLMNDFKWSSKSTSEIFNIESLAKFYAITDLTKAYHALIWHNMRFYINPVTLKLEIIAYDGYTMEWVKRPIFGNFNFWDGDKFSSMLKNIFSDKEFTQLYLKYLKLYSSEEYVRKFYAEMDTQFNTNYKNLQIEYPEYYYDKNILFKNADNIRKDIGDYEIFLSKKKNESNITNNVTQYTQIDNVDYQSIMVKAFLEGKTENTKTLKIFNYCFNEISIVGVLDGVTNKIQNFTPIKVNAFKESKLPIFVEIDVPINTSKILYTEGNLQTIFNTEIIEWKAPSFGTPEQELFENINLKSCDLYDLNGSKIIFKKGNHVLKNKLVIPKGYQVVISEGTEIDFINKSFFLSKSPVLIEGTIEKNVIIKSSDSSCLGFSIITAPEISRLKYVIFDGLNTLSYNGWNLTGAVNFYESQVVIENVSFTNNVCEDMLNIVRSNFDVNNCTFKNTYGDAFDSDFSTGKVDKCLFEHTKNDAIDFSGSNVKITNCEMRNIGDKAVSGGENSKLNISTVNINGANMGIASKDLSILFVDGANINNCKYGILQLVKKPEYGPSKLYAKNTVITNCKENILIEEKCFLDLNGEIIKGTQKKLASEFYK